MQIKPILILVVLTVGTCWAGSLQEQAKQKFRNALHRSIQEKLNNYPIKNLKDTIDGNAYIDEILSEAHDNAVAQGLDPYQLENIDVLGVDTNGYIAGYSNMHREGDAIVVQTDTTLTINVSVAIYDLEGLFNWSMTFLGIEYNGDADAQVDKVTAFATLQGPIEAGATSVVMQCQSLDVLDIGRITVEVHGFGIFDEIIDIVSQAVMNIIKDWVPWLLNNVVKVIVNDILPNHPFPLPTTFGGR